jgi:hypothetical protein
LEEVLADPAEAAGRRGTPQRGLVRDGAHDKGRDVVRIAVADACLVSGVSGLNELLCEGEVLADDDVDVLVVGRRSFLRVLHVHPFQSKDISVTTRCQGNFV